MKFKDLTGTKSNMLTVIEYAGKRKGKSYWKCRCDCGNYVEIPSDYVTTGRNKSCGCIKSVKGRKTNDIVHGLSKTRIHKIWCGMIARCFSQNQKIYKHYGAKGITVCDEWIGTEGFVRFYEWSMENGYSEKLSIDRIDVRGNYEPSNCRWVDMVVQNNNKTNNRFIEYNGEVHTMSEWSRIKNIPYNSLKSKLRRRTFEQIIEEI